LVRRPNTKHEITIQKHMQNIPYMKKTRKTVKMKMELMNLTNHNYNLNTTLIY